MTEATGESASGREHEFRAVSPLLTIGVLLLPFVFAWFVLRQGYGSTARIISLSWLGFAVLVSVMSPRSQEASITPPATEPAKEEATKPAQEKAEKKAKELSATGKSPHFVQPVKEEVVQDTFQDPTTYRPHGNYDSEFKYRLLLEGKRTVDSAIYTKSCSPPW